MQKELNKDHYDKLVLKTEKDSFESLESFYRFARLQYTPLSDGTGRRAIFENNIRVR